MSQEVNTVTETQIIMVNAASGTVAVISAGPMGPAGPPPSDAIGTDDVVSAVGPVGEITNKLPLYNGVGDLIGYIPIYDTIP